MLPAKAKREGSGTAYMASPRARRAGWLASLRDSALRSAAVFPAGRVLWTWRIASHRVSAQEPGSRGVEWSGC